MNDIIMIIMLKIHIITINNNTLLTFQIIIYNVNVNDEGRRRDYKVEKTKE